MNVAPVSHPDLQSSFGIVWAYRFDAAGSPALVPRDRLPELAPVDGGFVWVHLDLVHTRAQSWVAEQAAIPQQAKAIFLSHDALQRLDHSAELAWGILHDLIQDIGAKSDNVGALHWILDGRFLLTGRREALQAVRMTAETLGRGERIASAVSLFEHMIDYVIADLADAVARLMDETDSVEDHILADRLDNGPKRVGAVRRSAVGLHRRLNGLYLLFRRFAETNSGRAAPEPVRACAARLLQRIDSLHHDVHAVKERARLLQDEIAGASVSRTNRQLYTLSLLSAVFLPATFTTGLFGINVKGMPWAEHAWGFFIVILLCIAAAITTMILLKRRGVIG
jgi:zinc transporter